LQHDFLALQFVASLAGKENHGMRKGVMSRVTTQLRTVFTSLLAVSVLLAAGLVQGRPKTDTGELVNGNRVSGEIKGLENGVLKYSTDSMGTVGVEWQDVTLLDSSYSYRIRTTSGKRFFGTLDDTEKGFIRVVHAAGQEDIPADQVVGIVPIEDSFEERLDTTLSLGYSDFKSSDSRTFTAGLQMLYADAYSTNELVARSIVSENKDDTNRSSRVQLSRRRVRDKPTDFTYTGGSWESIDELGLDYRLALSMGLGRLLIDTSRSQLSLTLGAQGLTEENSAGVNTESLEGLGIVRYALWSFGDTDVDLTTNWRLYPGITESGRFRSDGDLTLSWEIINDLELSISAFGNFDNQSDDTSDDYDYGIITGVDWEF
jgi:hypothetical protein